jgi:hypothetical protein
MAHAAMVDTYLHRLLDERFAEDLDERDDVYWVPLACGARVRVVPGQGHALRVEVAAPVALDVHDGPELLEALNDINLGLPYGRVYLVDGAVVVEHTVAGEDLTGDDVDNALRFVSWVVDRYGVAVVDDFGGRTHGSRQMALPLSERSDDGAEDHRDANGQVQPGALVGASVAGYL